MKKIMKLVAVAAACMLFALVAVGCSSSSSASSGSSSAAFDSVSDSSRGTGDSRYVLVIGDDSWENYTPGHADMLMLMRLDFQKHAITLVTIPRDIKYVGADGTPIKLNEVLQQSGVDSQIEAVRKTTGVDVTDYVVIGFDGFQKIVENFGGVDVDLPYGLTYNFYTNDFPDEEFEAGRQTLTPWRAMALSRARTGYAKQDLDQDMMRQVVNRRMMVGLMEKAYADPSKTGSILKALQGTIQTSISVNDQIAWANALAADTDSITVYGTSGPFDGDIDEETEKYFVFQDPENWEKLIADVNAGKDPAAATAVYASGLESDIAPVCETFEIKVK